MAYTDPQSITVAGVAVPLPRTSFGVDEGAFSSSDRTYHLRIASSYGKRTRRTVRLSRDIISPDALNPSISSRQSMSAYIVVDTPVYGFSVVQQKELVDAFTAYLSGTSGARVTQLLGGEN